MYLLAHKVGKKIHVFAMGSSKFYERGDDWDIGRLKSTKCPICKKGCLPYVFGSVNNNLIKSHPSDKVGINVVY